MSAEDTLADVISLLETEPAPSSGPAGGLFPTAPGPNISAVREQLAVLVSTAKAEDAIGVQLTHEQVKRLSDKDVETYTKRYEAYVGSKTTESLINSFIFLATKAVGMAVKIKDIEAYQKELRNDYILNKELSNLAGNLSLKCGRFLAAANTVFITTKHVDFSPQSPVQSHPSRDENSNPLEAFEDVEGVPGAATAE